MILLRLPWISYIHVLMCLIYRLWSTGQIESRGRPVCLL